MPVSLTCVVYRGLAILWWLRGGYVHAIHQSLSGCIRLFSYVLVSLTNVPHRGYMCMYICVYVSFIICMCVSFIELSLDQDAHLD